MRQDLHSPCNLCRFAWTSGDDQQMAGRGLGNSAPFPDLHPFGIWSGILMSFDGNRGSIVKGAFQERSRGSLQLKNENNNREKRELG